MKISTKGRYGVAAMFELALSGEDTSMSLRAIAGNQDISEQYLEQLIACLKKAELVKSVRGAKGGYFLAKHPSDITVGSIIRAVEEPTVPVECAAPEGGSCLNASKCATRLVWQKISESINAVIDSITLQDMLDDNARLNKTDV